MRRILTLGVLALALAGCTATAPQPTSSATVARDSTGSPQGSAKPTLSDLVIGPDGLGPLVIGQPVPAQPDASAIVHFDDDYCVALLGDGAGTLAAGEPWAGAWISAYGTPEAFEVNTSDGLRSGPVGSIAVNDWGLDHRSVIGTAKGIHAGDTTGALKAAYPDFFQVTHNDLSDTYVLAGKTGFLTFEVSPHVQDGSGYWKADDLDRVLSIRASLQPSPSIVATDAGGHCVV